MTSFEKKNKKNSGCTFHRVQVDPLEPRFQTLPFARKIPSRHSPSVKEGIVTEPGTVPTPLVERKGKGSESACATLWDFSVRFALKFHALAEVGMDRPQAGLRREPYFQEVPPGKV